MEFAGICLTVAGATGALGAAVWLLVGFSPTDDRYRDDGPLYPGQQVSRVVPNLLRDQRRVAALMTVSAALQLLGVVLTVAASR